ncbi:hypothetical protein CAAU_0998 [Caloramator australicus RC3]|uniref:Uncharacterized protein n=1 Tax=Caloramator australicus RC3 TaxID=857293 RepID=I7LIM6_9CLOT|nr:hypothetical protein CAAU_0998 [Caloramator australicus RC3]
MFTNFDHATSDMDFDSLLFLNIFLTFKSSKIITWFSFIILEDNFCKKSFLWFLIFSCILATFLACFLKLLLPNCFLESFLCSLISLFSNFIRYLGLDILLPSLSIRKCFTPKSIPITLLVLDFSVVFSILQQIETKYFPVGVLLIVAFSILPSTSIDFTNFTQPNLGSLILFPLISMLLFVNVVL